MDALKEAAKLKLIERGYKIGENYPDTDAGFAKALYEFQYRSLGYTTGEVDDATIFALDDEAGTLAALKAGG